MEILVISTISAVIVFNVAASNCPPFDVNTVNVKGVLGENIHMQCDIDPKLCDKVLWKKKPSAYHLNETGCDNGYCIHHTTDKSVLEFPNVSPDHCGSYECWCNRGRPEDLLISCFELSAVCQMRIIFPGGTLVHNGSVSPVPGDAKAIDTKPGDRHKIECQDGAEHFTTCIPLDDGTFTVTEYEQECWHLCSLPVSEISEICEVRISLRVHQSNGQPSVPQFDDSLGVVHSKRVKRESDEGNVTIVTEEGDSNLNTTEESVSTTTEASSINSTGGVPDSEMITKKLTNQTQDSTSTLTTLSPPQPAGAITTSEIEEVPPMLNTTGLTDGTTTDNEMLHTSTMVEPAQNTAMVNRTQDTITNGTKQDDLLITKSKKTSELVSFFDDCTKLSIFVAVISFILSLLALMVAVSCCCYACYAFRHTGTAEINSKETAGDDIALEGVTVKDVTTEDTEDSEKGTQQGVDKSASPAEEPSATVSSSEPTTVKSPEATEASASQETQEKATSASQETQEKPCTEAMTDGDVVTENHVVDKTTQPEIKESPKETAQEASNAKEKTATEQQKTQDPEFPEPPEFPEAPESPEML